MIAPYKDKALARLKKVTGQVNGLIKMIEQDKYCSDVIGQLLAAQGGLRQVMPLLLESHLHTCGAENLASRDAKKREKFIREIVRACELSSR